MQACGEHSDATQKGLSRPAGLNPELFCCEVTVLQFSVVYQIDMCCSQSGCVLKVKVDVLINLLCLGIFVVVFSVCIGFQL